MSKNISKNYRFVKITILMSFVVLKIAIGTVFFVPIFSQNEQEPMKITYLPEKDTNLIEIPNDLVFTNLSIDDNININKNKLNKEESEGGVIEEDTVEEEELEYIKEKVMEVTAYTAGYESTGKTPDHPAYGVTASGEIVQENHTIACPPRYPFGTVIEIEGFDGIEFVCEDRGGAIRGDKLDVYIADLDEAIQFGRQKLEVKIIEWGG